MVCTHASKRTYLARAWRPHHEDGRHLVGVLVQQVADGLDVARDVPPAPQRGAQDLRLPAALDDGDAVQRACSLMGVMCGSAPGSEQNNMPRVSLTHHTCPHRRCPRGGRAPCFRPRGTSRPPDPVPPPPRRGPGAGTRAGAPRGAWHAAACQGRGRSR